MSEKDQAELDTEKLLPCRPSCQLRYPQSANEIWHALDCPWEGRLTVAAKLREKDAALIRANELLASAREVGEQRRLEIEKLRVEIKAEAKRVTERDINILQTAPPGQVWLIDREDAKDAIRAAQAKECGG